MIWLRMDALFDSHPKGIAAGFWGRRAAETAWRAIKLHGWRGEVGPNFCTGEFLSRLAGCMITDVTEPAVTFQRGIDAAINAGLFERTPSGGIKAHDWGQRQIDPSAAERQANFRDKHGKGATAGQAVGNGCNGSNGYNADGTGSGRDLDGTGTPPPPNGPEARRAAAQSIIGGWWSECMLAVRGSQVNPDPKAVVAAAEWAVGMNTDIVKEAVRRLVCDNDPFVVKRGWTLAMLPERAPAYLAAGQDDDD